MTDNNKKSTDINGVGALAVGGASALVGYAGAEYQLNKQLLPFDTQVAEQTVTAIKGMGITGGLVGSGGVITDGSGIAGGVVKENTYLQALKTNKLARTLHNVGGRQVVSTAAALVAGAVGLLIGMMVFRRKQESSELPLAQAHRHDDSCATESHSEPKTAWTEKTAAQKAEAQERSASLS